MTEAGDDALIDAILAAPDDDGPRLVYADVLTERGDPRGEYIVVQCERARLEREGERGTRAHHEVARREREIEEAHVKSWVDPVGLRRWWGEFQRGFIQTLSISPNGLRTRWDVFARQPLETLKVKLVPHDTTLTELAWIAEHVTRPRQIWLLCNDGDVVLDATRFREALANGGGDASPWPRGEFLHPRLRGAAVSLSLSHAKPAIFAEIATLPNLTALTCRDLSQLAPRDIEALLATRVLENVTYLHGVMRDDVAIALLRGRFSKLRELGLIAERRAAFTPIVARACAESAILPRLESFRSDLVLDKPLARALWVEAKALRSLTLEKSAVDDEALDALLRCDLMDRLRALWIRGPEERVRPRALLAARFAQLRALCIDHFRIEDDDARAMVASWPSVNDLHVFGASAFGGKVRELLQARWPEAQVS